MLSPRMLHRVALVRTDVSEELSTYLIRVTRIGELGTTLAVTSNRRTLRRIQDNKAEVNCSINQYISFITNKTKKQTPWPLVRERTIPTERPPLVDEI
jgi:hypothetical protein